MAEPTPRLSGTVSRWTDRGFGFISPGDGGEDLFCHFSDVQDGNALEEGATVEFIKVYDERKGKERAEQVTGGITVESNGRGLGGNVGGRGFGSFVGGGGRGVCFDWQKGQCNRGPSCRFAHSEGVAPGYGGYGGFFGRSRGVCYDWQKGQCNRGPSCRFLHEEMGLGVGGFASCGYAGGYGGFAAGSFAGGPGFPGGGFGAAFPGAGRYGGQGEQGGETAYAASAYTPPPPQGGGGFPAGGYTAAVSMPGDGYGTTANPTTSGTGW